MEQLLSDLEVPQTLAEKGDPGGLEDEKTTELAAERGDLECLKYAREHGCPWSEETTLSAALGGHLECLKYAHENGCRWDEGTTRAAAANGHLECLVYARDNGCPFNPDGLRIGIFENRHLIFLKRP